MEEIIAYKSWEEIDGEWMATEWVDSMENPIDNDLELFEIVDTDKYGRPIKAKFRPIPTS